MIYKFKSLALILPFAFALNAAAQTPVAQPSPQTTVAQEAQPQIDLATLDINALLKDAARNAARADKQMLLEYTWTSEIKTSYFDKKNQLKDTESETTRVYPRYGSQAEVVISKNGKAASAEQIEKDEKRLAKELIADEEKRQKYAAALDNLNYGVSIAVGDNETGVYFRTLLESARFSNPRLVDLEGRRTILLDFAPKLQPDALGDNIKYLAFVSGQVWIDAADRQPAKMTAFLTDAALQQAAAQRDKKAIAPADADNTKPSLLLEKTRLPDGAWLLKRFRIYTLLAPFAFDDLRVEFTGENTKFERFVASVEEYKPETKPQP